MSYYDALFGSVTDLQHVYDFEDPFEPQFPSYDNFWDQGFGIEPPTETFLTTPAYPAPTFSWQQPQPVYDNVPQETTNDQAPERGLDEYVVVPAPQEPAQEVACYTQPAYETWQERPCSYTEFNQVPYQNAAVNVLTVEPFPETPVRGIKEKRKIENETEELELYPEGAADQEDDPTGGFKLPASKSPIMEAMVVCALKGWGIDIVKNSRGSATDPVEVIFQVHDFDRYYRISRLICSKQRPTDDVGSRVKSLRRWFVNFPKKKDRNDNVPFLLEVKPNIAKKVSEIIERNTRMYGLTKRRRRQ